MRRSVSNFSNSPFVSLLQTFSLRHMLIFGLLYVTVSSCYLNSCPYLRSSRAEDKCGMCGKTGDGVCVTQGVCCTTEGCKEDKKCSDVECPLPYCQIEDGTGFCASSTLCCSEKFCQRTIQCLQQSGGKKVKRSRFRRHH